MTKKTKGWSKERKRRQAEAIKRWQPWQKSSGPKTKAGKAVVSKNALKHGLRSAEYRELCALLREAAAMTNAITGQIIHDHKSKS